MSPFGESPFGTRPHSGSDSRDALARLLQAHDYTVRQAENGRIALDLIAERVPGFMILDLEMPVVSGWEVLASLQRTGALKAIVVVLSAAAAVSPPVPTTAESRASPHGAA